MVTHYLWIDVNGSSPAPHLGCSAHNYHAVHGRTSSVPSSKRLRCLFELYCRSCLSYEGTSFFPNHQLISVGPSSCRLSVQWFTVQWGPHFTSLFHGHCPPSSPGCLSKRSLRRQVGLSDTTGPVSPRTTVSIPTESFFCPGPSGPFPVSSPLSRVAGLQPLLPHGEPVGGMVH